jgi:O-succinylbenzoate synthase
VSAPLADLGSLRIRSVGLHRVAMRFRHPIRTAGGVVEGRRPLLVHVRGDGGEEGWGECAAEDAPGYWHEWAGGCEAAVESLDLAGVTVDVGDIPAVHSWPMASAAVEGAVLDALCRRAGISLASWLGATNDRVEATLTVGIDEPVDEQAAAPYRNIKLKAASGVDLDVARWNGRTVSADANGSLRPDDLAAFAGAGLHHLEQPLGADDWAGHAELRRTHPGLPLALDESIRTVADVERTAADAAADIVVLKPGRLGGLRAARGAHDAAVAAGLRCKVGGMWDTGIGRAAALAVAGLPGCTVAPDLSAADRYWERDVVTDPAVLDADGCLAVPTGPGIGVEVSLP